MDNVLSQLNSLLPNELKIKEKDLPLTKKKLSSILVEYAKKYPESYANNIHKIGELGEELGYMYGHNVGLSDLNHPKKKEIKKLLDNEEKKMSKMSTKEKKKHVLKVFDKLTKMVGEIKNNALVDQGYSRGRGNPNTITRTIGASAYTVDMNSEPFPFLIKNSMSSGFRSHEMFAAGAQARYAAVSTASSTSEPGAMSKVLIANLEHIKIGCEDCHTRNGVEYPITSPEIIGKYEGPTGKLITKQYITELKKKGKKLIIVRTPQTCECTKGVCRKCYGSDRHGVGTEIGIIAGQTLGEKSTQLVLSAKHHIAGSVKSNIPTGFEAQKIILSSPDSYRGKATLASTDGKVDKVEKLATGGYNIYIANKPHYVSSDVEPLVRAGHFVEKGQQISTGLASTKDVLTHKGILQARQHMVDELYKANDGSIDKNVLGVVARGIVDLVKEKNDKMGTLYSFNKKYPEMLQNKQLGSFMSKVSINDPQIYNKYLAKNFLHYTAGTKITKEIVSALKRHGISYVEVTHNPNHLEGVYKTYEQKPLATGSLWDKLNYRGIKKGFQEELLYNTGVNVNGIESNRTKYTLNKL